VFRAAGETHPFHKEPGASTLLLVFSASDVVTLRLPRPSERSAPTPGTIVRILIQKTCDPLIRLITIDYATAQSLTLWKF